ncbi:glycosyltransferase family 4 protein [Kaarinaea lacus]
MNIASSVKGNTLVICLSPYSGGMEMDAIKLAKLLSQDVEITLLAKSDCFIDRYYKKNMSDTHIALATVNFSTAFSLAIIRKTRRVLKEKSIKNVIFFGASELRSLYFAFLGSDLNVIVRHGTTKTRPKKDWLHRLIYSCVDYHVAICQHLADNVKFIIPFAKKTQLKVIYPSLRQLPVLSNKREKGKVVRLLHVGRVADGKGQREAIDACAILYERNVPFELVLVGDMDPGYGKIFNEHLYSKQYAESIRMTGYTDNVTKYYQQAEIFIFPSKGEGLSNSFIEALSYGLICIAYENTSFPELQQLGFTFFLAQDKNIEELKKILLQAVEQRKKVSIPLVDQAKRALSIFGAEREKNEYLDLLQ